MKIMYCHLNDFIFILFKLISTSGYLCTWMMWDQTVKKDLDPETVQDVNLKQIKQHIPIEEMIHEVSHVLRFLCFLKHLFLIIFTEIGRMHAHVHHGLGGRVARNAGKWMRLLFPICFSFLYLGKVGSKGKRTAQQSTASVLGMGDCHLTSSQGPWCRMCSQGSA